MATPNDPRYFRDGTPRDGVLRNRNPLETPSTAPRAVTAPTQGTVTLPFADGRTPTGRTDAELATMAATQAAAADADIARRRVADRNGTSPIAAGTVGYFVGSDGRKQTFTPESAQAKAAMLPTSNTMPAGIALGDGNFAASNDGRRAVGSSAPAAAPAAAPTADQRYEALLRTGMSPATARIAADSQAKQDAEIASALARNRENGTAWGAPTPPPAGTPASGTTPTGVTTVASGTGALARRSPVDEFNDIRAGLARPGLYDPSGATSRARSAATSVVRSNSDANRILQMAANLASDPRLKGFPGARNAIIQGLVGQIGADSSAALEGLRQAGNAGISGQEFDQDGVLQETGRRGQVLRDQFLADNEERLQGLNNDAALQRTIIGSLLSGQGRGGGSGSKEDNRRLDDLLEAAREANPDDPLAAAAATLTGTRRMGVDPSGTYSGNEAIGTIRDGLTGALNNGVPRWSEGYMLGLDGDQRFTLEDDTDLANLTVLDDSEASGLLDFTNYFLPQDWETYVIEGEAGNPNSRRAISPLLSNAPTRQQLNTTLRALRRPVEE